MLAHHPLTGKPIRVLNMDTSLWKDNKTLWCGENKPTTPLETVFTPTSDSIPTYALHIEGISLEDLVKSSTESKMVFVSKAVVDKTGVKGIREANLSNLICLEEMNRLFPHLGPEWDGTLNDAYCLIAGILRCKNVIGDIQLSPRATLLHLSIGEKPSRLWWVTQYYVPPKAKRRREIETCLKKNIESPLIDRVVLLNEKKETFPNSQKVEERVIGHWLTYKDVLDTIQTFPEDVVVAFANADICIDSESWKDLWNINLENKLLALLRYDVTPETPEGKLFGPRADSQDTWIVRVKDVKNNIHNTKAFEIPFGKAGCDNAILTEFMRSKFHISNPALSIKTFHYHDSGVRGYNPQDIVDKPIFIHVTPTGIHDLEPVVSDLGTKPIVLEDCFLTDDGLVFDRQKMYIGTSVESRKRWSSAMIHGLTPTVECETGILVPFEKKDMMSRESYVLRILSKVFQLREQKGFESGEWFCPEDKQILEVLQMFNFNSPRVPVIKYEPHVHVWCKKALYQPISQTVELSSNDIQSLRRGCKGWRPTMDEEKRLVVIEDNDSTLTDLIESQLEEKGFDVKVLYSGKTSGERIWETLRGAWGVVCSSSLESWCWNWLLPEGARVFMIGSSKEGEALSSYGRLSHTSVKKETIIQEISQSGESKPIIWMPRKGLEGYFAHAGDSFREMARVWEERGYVRVKEHPSAVMCWWDQVGKDGVLLYDRPNHDWRMAAPINEKSWKLALFGNPKAFGEKGKPWFFWPRRPEYVEKLVENGLPGWDSRGEGVVFYGKIENRVQERRRTQMNWSEACSPGVWSMVKNTEPYPFTQKEYLEHLAKARFGLCLAGYGYKCHREVECMAMGCVPLVAPDVDMDSYYEPPVEGVHYIRVKSPEEARQIAKEMSKDDWESMSKAAHSWWKRNCSVEGSFQLTKQIIESN